MPQAYPQQQPGYQAQGHGTCRICGSDPAAEATFRAVVGVVFMHTMWTAPGPYCRDCGMPTFRQVANLSAPHPRGDGRAPLDPGPSLFQRPAAYVYPAMGMVLLLLIIVGNLG